MASKQSIVDFILEQIESAGEVSSRKMFGEHAIYCDGKVVALVCNDQLFVKITPSGRALATDAEEGTAYKGAKPSMIIPADNWEDREWLSSLIKSTAADLPLPKKRKPKKPKP